MRNLFLYLVKSRTWLEFDQESVYSALSQNIDFDERYNKNMRGYFARLVKTRHASMTFPSVNSWFHLRLSSKYVFKKKSYWVGGMAFCFSTHQDASLWYIFLKFTVINLPYTNLFNMNCCSKKISPRCGFIVPCITDKSKEENILSVIRTWQRTKGKYLIDNSQSKGEQNLSYWNL